PVLDTRSCGTQISARVDTPAACALFGMVNVSLCLRTLAIGERVGNAGPDLFRSPMKRRCHARLPRRKSYSTRPARGIKSKGYRNHTWRSSGVDRKGVRLRELEHFVRQNRSH